MAAHERRAQTTYAATGVKETLVASTDGKVTTGDGVQIEGVVAGAFLVSPKVKAPRWDEAHDKNNRALKTAVAPARHEPSWWKVTAKSRALRRRAG